MVDRHPQLQISLRDLSVPPCAFYHDDGLHVDSVCPDPGLANTTLGSMLVQHAIGRVPLFTGNLILGFGGVEQPRSRRSIHRYSVTAESGLASLVAVVCQNPSRRSKQNDCQDIIQANGLIGLQVYVACKCERRYSLPTLVAGQIKKGPG